MWRKFWCLRTEDGHGESFNGRQFAGALHLGHGESPQRDCSVDQG
jgi:hypothetical protein